MKQVFAVLRHGERADYARTNRITRVQGDPPLTEVGLIQAEKAAEELASRYPNPSSIKIISSPFTRCVETASKLARRWSVPLYIEEGFAEIMKPDYFEEGILDRVLSKSNPQLLENELGVRIIQENHILRPDFPESSSQCKNRLKRVWHEFYLKYRDVEIIVIVSHLFVVDELYRVWTKVKKNWEMDYCKLGICEIADGDCTPILLPTSSYLYR